MNTPPTSAIQNPEMSAQEVWDDAQQVLAVLRSAREKTAATVQIPIAFSALLIAVEQLKPDELRLLRQRIEARLAE